MTYTLTYRITAPPISGPTMPCSQFNTVPKLHKYSDEKNTVQQPFLTMRKSRFFFGWGEGGGGCGVGFSHFFLKCHSVLEKSRVPLFYLLLRQSISDHYLWSCGYVNYSRPHRRTTRLRLEPWPSRPKVLGFTTTLHWVCSCAQY